MYPEKKELKTSFGGRTIPPNLIRASPAAALDAALDAALEIGGAAMLNMVMKTAKTIPRFIPVPLVPLPLTRG
jgi:hypothetical protein